MTFISSYEPNAPLPKPGSRWVWEIDSASARSLIEVVETSWNGEEWWVRTKTLLPDSFALAPINQGRNTSLNDVSRFWEACTPVGNTKGKLTEYRPNDAQAPTEA